MEAMETEVPVKNSATMLTRQKIGDKKRLKTTASVTTKPQSSQKQKKKK